MSATAPGLVVFDGDDTLWSSQRLYDEAKAAISEALSWDGIDTDLWRQTMESLDVSRYVQYGVSIARFPGSCVLAYEEVARVSGRTPNAATARQVRELAARVFTEAAATSPVANLVLSAVRDMGYALALITRGEAEVQERRISDSGLAPYFSKIQIVADKTAGEFRSLVEQSSLRASDSWSVGNSRSSDVDPALEVGMYGIWLNVKAWDHTASTPARVGYDRCFVVRDLAEVPSVIARGRLSASDPDLNGASLS